nr:hypothetical protein [uncultured Desulfuromonas sp.]
MRLILLSILLALIASPSVTWANPFANDKFPFEEGSITYKVEGNTSGSQMLYVKDHGQTTAEYTQTTTKMFGIVQQENTLTLTTPDWVYDIDLTTRSATKSVNPEKYYIEEYNKLSSADQKKVDTNAEKFGISTVESLQGTVEKKAATILGYPCDITSMMGVKVYTASQSGLVLKTESNMMGMKSLTEATHIDKGSIPDSKFAIPSGIDILEDHEADAMARQMAVNVIESLRTGQQPTVTAQPSQGYDDGQEQNQQFDMNDLQNQLNKLMNQQQAQ